MNEKCVIGLDLGGTNLRGAVVDEEGKILAREKKEVGDYRDTHHVILLLSDMISSLKKSYEVQSVGLGVPGIVSAEKGLVYSSPHFPLWKDFDLSAQLSEKIQLPLTIDNDANMMALGEATYGSGKEWNHFLMVTLGTGIGGGLVMNRKIWHGDNGFAGEFGHMVIEADGMRCNCGSRGCFEMYASATGITRMAELLAVDSEMPGARMVSDILRSGSASIVKKLAEEARKGNESCRGIFDKMGVYLGMGLASLINVTGMQKVVLGGGLISSSDLFLPQAKISLAEHTYKKTAEGVEIILSQLGDDAGIMGAASLAFSQSDLNAA